MFCEHRECESLAYVNVHTHTENESNVEINTRSMWEKTAFLLSVFLAILSFCTLAAALVAQSVYWTIFRFCFSYCASLASVRFTSELLDEYRCVFASICSIGSSLCSFFCVSVCKVFSRLYSLLFSYSSFLFSGSPFSQNGNERNARHTHETISSFFLWPHTMKYLHSRRILHVCVIAYHSRHSWLWLFLLGSHTHRKNILLSEKKVLRCSPKLSQKKAHVSY